MSYATELSQALSDADKLINLAYESKTKILDELLSDINPICNKFYDLWDQNEALIKDRISNIAKKLNFKLNPCDYHNDLGLPKFMEHLSDNFPIFNASGDDIIDSLPRTSHAWSIQNNSDVETIRLEVNPIDIYARYPSDPDDNEYAFKYEMPLDVHEKLINADEDEQHSIIEMYFNNTVDLYLIEIEHQMKQKSALVNETVDKLDFNNPELVAALKQKLDVSYRMYSEMNTSDKNEKS